MEISWNEDGLVPAVVQDVATREVLMLAYMNREALERTLETGESWFWSRSRAELWHKGSTSGHRQRVVEIRYDCDADALLLGVEPAGPACHTGEQSCFYRHLPAGPAADAILPPGSVLPRLEAIIHDRKTNTRPGSYTCQLLAAGLHRLAQKVGEEAIEVLLAAQGEADERLSSEVADLVYHLLVLLAARGLTWTDVEAELARRFNQGNG
jgi:phosphoribosyl-ATP pyrophosphohydrolase/phosphoribosyl-AMP cyclohydrolase